jgi:hypothetical protein
MLQVTIESVLLRKSDFLAYTFYGGLTALQGIKIIIIYKKSEGERQRRDTEKRIKVIK